MNKSKYLSGWDEERLRRLGRREYELGIQLPDKVTTVHSYVSQIVIDEVSAGDPEESQKRMEIIDIFPVLEVTGEAELLAKAILGSGAIPSRAVRDAAHVAVAAVHDVDYLLTWNCTHLANAQVIRKISVVCNREGFNMPTICTPEELMGG